MTGFPDTDHRGGLRTAVRRVLWLAGLLLGLWFLFWILADEAEADGIGAHLPVVDQIVQPVVPDVGKVLAPVREPVVKVVRGLEKGPVRDLLKPVGKVVDALPAPLPNLIKPVLKPVGSVGETVGGLIPDPGAVLPTSAAHKKAKLTYSALTVTHAVPRGSVATTKSSATTATGHDFRIPVEDKGQQPKARPAHQPTGHASVSDRPAAPVKPAPAPDATVSAAGSVAADVVHDAAADFTEPGQLAPPHGVFAPLWRSLKPGTSPG